MWYDSRIKYRFRVDNRLEDPYDKEQFEMVIIANNTEHAMIIAAEIGFKHHMLLTLIE